MSEPTRIVAILPCNDMDATTAFFARLGFTRPPEGSDYEGYRILTDGRGAELHLSQAPEGWLIPGRSPFGIYLYADNVEELAERMGDLLLHRPRHQPWGMFEFAVSDPDENLVRVGRPSGSSKTEA